MLADIDVFGWHFEKMIFPEIVRLGPMIEPFRTTSIGKSPDVIILNVFIRKGGPTATKAYEAYLHLILVRPISKRFWEE